MIRILVLGLAFCSLALCDYDGYIAFQTVPAKAGPAPISPYTLLISGTFPAFGVTASGGHITHTTTCGVNSISCPADLLFSRDSACGTPVAGWEILAWSPTTGQLTAMVKIPLLSNTRPVKIYACAGNPAVTTFQGGARGSAYDSNYVLGFHMDETSGSILHDSTANANDAVKKNAGSPSSTPSGKFGGGQRFTGMFNSVNNDYALLGSPTPRVNTYTIEYWTNAVSYVNQDAVFLESHGGPAAPAIFTAFGWYPAGKIFFKNAWNSSTPSTAALADAGVFHNLVYVRTGDTMNVFLDGVAGAASAGFGTYGDEWIGFGWDGGASLGFNSFNGTLDEVFYSDAARTPGYVTARYNNLSSPSTFYTASPFTPFVAALQSTTAANSQVNIF